MYNENEKKKRVVTSLRFAARQHVSVKATLNSKLFLPYRQYGDKKLGTDNFVSLFFCYTYTHTTVHTSIHNSTHTLKQATSVK